MGYDVILLRHGETVGYAGDLGLTDRGEAQARAAGTALAGELAPGTTVRMPHARSARGTATAVVLRAALVEAVAGGADIGPLYAEPWFDNLRVSLPDGVYDANVAVGERLARGDGPTPDWMVEYDRFDSDYGAIAARGGPIDFWVATPTLFLEPPHLTAHRAWRGVVAAGAGGPERLVVVVCTHSALLRSLVTTAIGRDAGEPDHLEQVRVRVHAEGCVALRFRDHAAALAAPPELPPWLDAGWLERYGR